ncbi:MAG: hypothetical protein KDC53_11035, partial [Saprospiraceae bacterium]|nr:hypothetical protein [Saprospiraceae bacterium]
PDPGCAVKELFFTRKDDSIYAISPRWPGAVLIVKDLQLPANSKIELLGGFGSLSWHQQGNGIEIQLPAFDPEKFKDEKTYGYVFKIHPLE